MLPLPDGVVIGRCNLEEVAAAAEVAVQAALQQAAADLTSTAGSEEQQQQQQPEKSSSSSNNPLSSTEGEDIITSINTTVERGVPLQVNGGLVDEGFL